MNLIKSLLFISALAMVLLCVHCQSEKDPVFSSRIAREVLLHLRQARSASPLDTIGIGKYEPSRHKKRSNLSSQKVHEAVSHNRQARSPSPCFAAPLMDDNNRNGCPVTKQWKFPSPPPPRSFGGIPSPGSYGNGCTSLGCFDGTGPPNAFGNSLPPGSFDSGNSRPGSFDSGFSHPGSFDSGFSHPGSFGSSSSPPRSFGGSSSPPRFFGGSSYPIHYDDIEIMPVE